MEPMRISSSPKNRIEVSSRSTVMPCQKRGMTLFETILVFTLIAVIGGFFGSRIFGIFRVGTQSAVKNFGTMVSYAYNQAVFTGLVHRIVIDLNEQSWRLESAPPQTLPLEYSMEQQDPDKKIPAPDENGASADGFQDVGGKSVPKLPDGVKIVSVTSPRLGGTKKPMTEGVASIYIFPSGYMDQAEIRIATKGSEDQQVIAIRVQRLTGRIKWEPINL